MEHATIAAASAATLRSGPRFEPYRGHPPLEISADARPIIATIIELAHEVGGMIAAKLDWSRTAVARDVTATLGWGNFSDRHILFFERLGLGASGPLWTGEVVFGVRDPRASLACGTRDGTGTEVAGELLEATIVAKVAIRFEDPARCPNRLATEPFLATAAVEAGRVVFRP